LIFLRDEARVGVNLGRAETSENKWLYDRLFAEKENIETTFGTSLEWRRMDDKRSCKITFAQPFDGYNRENWPDMIKWMSTHILKLEEAFRSPLARLNPQIRDHEEEGI
jgi:hypothetical protein